MAAYEYDEAGVMATYFLLTVLALVLIPVTLASLGKRSDTTKHGCDCKACQEQRARIKKREGSIFSLKFSTKTYLLLGGWTLVALLSWRASKLKTNNKVYDPFEILGISSSATEKEIKSHYKKLSRQFHPDKVKVTAEMTLEQIQDRFVQITKAYKSLTDEKIRKNWLEWNNPDGPQSTSMGIALPKWIVESQNNIWVLGFYGLLFGGALPAVVGRWWFGNRQKTKDGVHAQSAATFFKYVREESSVDEIVSSLGKAYKWELPQVKSGVDTELAELEKAIVEKVGSRYAEVKKSAKDADGTIHPSRARALALIYAHLCRIEVKNPALAEEQRRIILSTPLLLSALLNVAIARNWLIPTLWAMRLHSYIAQALPPDPPPRVKLTQLPLSKADIDSMSPRPKDMHEVLVALEDKTDEKSVEAKKALAKWGRVEIVDAGFKVIGERVISPSSIVFLVVKLRLTPPGVSVEPKDLSVEETKRVVKMNDEKDEAFLLAKGDAEEISEERIPGYAHAPYWPAGRKPTWWIVLGDDKQNRIVVPPMRVSEIPYADSESERDYRSYKIQFQAPPQVGLFTWRLYVVSDTYAGEDAVRDVQLKIEEPVHEDEPSEDDISDPDEDTLAGQMAAMRGGAVKKRRDESDDDDDDDDSDEETEYSDTTSDSDSD
ncbi:translocation protein sec63 [Coprinopsis cinerea okayama7|uniref:Translocation protein sec63 n=1 Tax=Coprinopsis cinerea (strain Okayama-7 / 130 / ATCC MYA-4618 / FGSC 9003) TaxID=240176 RepID=A8P7U8_COPC7|nr:translocation protein sec63 [Coprinopsis cinerea okayama7\|eukprot:XP_001839430.1 translocation protein sec63 [Coprinopsis cinerea okayama7\